MHGDGVSGVLVWLDPYRAEKDGSAVLCTSQGYLFPMRGMKEVWARGQLNLAFLV